MSADINDHYPTDVDPSVILELRVATCAIITDDAGHILLQHRADNDLWGMPGGALEKGESVAQGVVREVKEETGYDVEIVGVVGVYSDPKQRQVVRYPDNVVQYVVVSVHARITGGEGGVDHESHEQRWFEPGALPEPMVPNHIVRLRDFTDRHASGPAPAELR